MRPECECNSQPFSRREIVVLSLMVIVPIVAMIVDLPGMVLGIR